MANPADPPVETFDWQPQPQAAALVAEKLDSFCQRCPEVRRFASMLNERTGTRLIDWVDHLALPSSEHLERRLREAGFVSSVEGPRVVWEHPAALAPPLVIHDQPIELLAVKVESVADFLAAQGLINDVKIEGRALGQLRKARVSAQSDSELWVIERHGWRGWEAPELTADAIDAAGWHQAAFRERRRHFAEEEEGFAHALQLIRAAVSDLGAGWAADLFFAAERQYWTSRNRAAQVQKARQDALGLGWGNHDHHTYRSSRRCFTRLIAALEELGLVCRERLYAGREAGWGAQVLEQEASGVVVFADVDLAAAEVAGDFAHGPLAPQEHFGTVGLWCLLHGEAFFEPGLHHLECRFDFEAARTQLGQAGIAVMPLFTDLPYLKQAFTEGEGWPLASERLDAALDAGAITAQQREHFRRAGALGSHLEILERNEGYKGFNQSGINEIIRDTDPRRQSPQAGRSRPPNSR
jgi:hypothetical protein